MRQSPSRLFLLLCLLGSIFSPSDAYSRCGVERWDVKVGRDTEAGSVDLSSPMPTTIADLTDVTRYPAPGHWPPPQRIAPVETTLWVVSATLLRYKFEDDPHTGDSDYHLVISDAVGHTMIAEIPFPDCAQGSQFLNRIRVARSAFDARYTPTGSFQDANIPVRIAGVGMFDKIAHGSGHSPNGMEIHPVLDIIFNPGSASLVTSSSIMDPGFEAGPGSPAWQASLQVIDNSDNPPAHGGSYKAWLGGYGQVHTDTLSQQVTLPYGASQITLSLWIQIGTDEVKNQAFDKMSVQVKDAGGAVLATLGTLSNLDAAEGYVQKIYDLTPFSGKTVQIIFTAKEDAAKVTSFVIDDLALTTSHQ